MSLKLFDAGILATDGFSNGWFWQRMILFYILDYFFYLSLSPCLLVSHVSLSPMSPMSRHALIPHYFL